jgi:hypothetical protein
MSITVLHKLTPAELRAARKRSRPVLRHSDELVELERAGPSIQFLNELFALEKAALNGKRWAVQCIWAMRDYAAAFYAGLPKSLKKKRHSGSEPASNRLAIMLLSELREIHAGRRENPDARLTERIRKQDLPITKASRDWWQCAWALVKVMKDPETATLRSEIRESAISRAVRELGGMDKVKDLLLCASAQSRLSHAQIKYFPAVQRLVKHIKSEMDAHLRRKLKQAVDRCWP